MRELTVSLLVLALGAGLWSDGGEAARLGGGRSLGAQRQITTPPKQATPPAQQPAPQPSGAGRWLAPLAGLAAGLGLGWLFAQGGFAEVLGALLMALLAGAAAYALIRMVSRPRTQIRQAQYVGMGEEPFAAPPSRPLS